MRMVSLAGLALPLLMTSCQAAAEAYFPWCVIVLNDGGSPSCGFVSQAQCLESARGSGGYCRENLAAAPAAPAATTIPPDPMPAARPPTTYPWCAVTQHAGAVNCGYATQQRCVRSLIGRGGFCTQNNAAPASAAIRAEFPEPADERGPSAPAYLPWCAVDAGASGTTNCGFESRLQCMEVIGPRGGWCGENPAAPPPEDITASVPVTPAQAPTPKAKNKQARRAAAPSQ